MKGVRYDLELPGPHCVLLLVRPFLDITLTLLPFMGLTNQMIMNGYVFGSGGDKLVELCSYGGKPEI